jgi:hypothetical protein
MAVAGLVRLRKHQFGRQDSFGTKVAATRAYAFKGVPTTDLQWTDPDVDVGSIVPTVAPERGTGSFVAPLTDPQLAYNTLPLLMEGVFGGNVNPSGGAIETWTHTPSAVAPLDDSSVFTYEFFDDTGADDADQLGDGILDSVTISGPEGLGALTTSMAWRFGSAASNDSTDSTPSPAVPTAGLDVESNPALVYLKDMGIYIASDAASLSSGQVTDALHSFEMVISQENDDKRFANATQTFDVSDRSRTGYSVALTASWAKTDDIIGTGSETDAWFSDTAVDRYIRLDFTSTKMISGATPYSWRVDMPMRYYTRTHGDSAGNAIVILEGHAFYDSGTFDGFFKSTIKNSLHAADLGSAAS